MIVAQKDLSQLVEEGLVLRPDGVSASFEATSIGLHLGDKFLRYKDLKDSVPLPYTLQTEEISKNKEGLIDFPPGACLLACSLEKIRMPLNCMGFIQTKGTIARGFVTVHLCDGQVDPGFDGCITLELVNLSKIHYTLKHGTAIAQLFVHKLTQPVNKGYSGRYQFSDGPTSMRNVLQKDK